jgi:hypothetical protein
MTREVPREQWNRFFDDFSKPRLGWIVSLEVFGSAIGAQEAATGLPLKGISSEPNGRASRIEITVGGWKQRVHLTHTIEAPTRVWHDRPETRIDGAREAIEVESEDGTATLLAFRRVLAQQVERLLPERTASRTR